MNSNPEILTNVFGYDEKDVEFDRVINDIRNIDINSIVYHRRK